MYHFYLILMEGPLPRNNILNKISREYISIIFTFIAYLNISKLRLCRWRGGSFREQGPKWNVIGHRRAAGEVLANKSWNLVCCIVILSHDSNVAVMCFPKFHLFLVVGIYMNNLPSTWTQASDDRHKRKIKMPTSQEASCHAYGSVRVI